jgi:hypothetical protein
MARQPWKQPLPNEPYVKPNFKRGQDQSTTTKVLLPDQPLERTKQFLVGDKIITLKRSWLTAFDAARAQDAAVAKAASALTATIDSIEVPPPSKVFRRDSIQDVSSRLTETPKLVPVASKEPVSPAPTENADAPASRRPSTEKLAENFAEKQKMGPSQAITAPISPAPTEINPLPTVTVTPSTERSEIRKSATPVPKGLEINGTSALDPHKPDVEIEMVRTYLWKGRRFEVQGDEPEEWLRDVRETPKNPTAARASSAARSSITPALTSSGRTRQSLRGSSSQAEGRRRSTRQG